MRHAWKLAKMFAVAMTVILVFSIGAVGHDLAKAWRCRPDAFQTAYERADACRPESWR